MERDLDRLAVKIAVKVEQMCFKQLLRLEHRAMAKARHLAPPSIGVGKADAHRIYSVGGAQKGPSFDIGGRPAKPAARLSPWITSASIAKGRESIWIAVPAAGAWRASRIRPEEMRSPSSSTAPTVSATMPWLAPSSRSVHIAAPALAEGEVLAGYHARRAERSASNSTQSPRHGRAGELGAKFEHQHRISPGMVEHPLPLVSVVRRNGGVSGLKMAHRVRSKVATMTRRPRARHAAPPPDHRLVAEWKPSKLPSAMIAPRSSPGSAGRGTGAASRQRISWIEFQVQTLDSMCPDT